MSQVYRILVQLCWAAGLLSVLAALVLKFVPTWVDSVAASPRGALIFASALFLCALATREMEAGTS